MSAEHQCANAEHCVGYDKRTKEAEWTDGLPLCAHCLLVAHRDIGRLAQDHGDLAEHLQPSISQWGDGQPYGYGEPAMPLLGHIDALQREIEHVTATWEEITRDYCGLSAPTHPDVNRAVATLLPRLEQVCLIPAVTCQVTGCEDPWTDIDGVAAIAMLVHLHQRARGHLGLTDDTRQLPGHCQNKRCAAPALTQANGSDTVNCGRCGARMTRDEYERYGNAFLRGVA
jgi:hypothetical protein